jgi:tetratricopeptide (TPR) repeat protein
MTDTASPQDPLTSADQAKAAFFDQQTGAFFRRADWGAFWTVFLISFAVYLFTLAPTVTLEDSGELAVASDYLGVPHPPGYPIWTLGSWAFQRIFHGIEYHGYPNPAWAVGLMSAFFGALACALLALLVSRSGVDMMRHLKSLSSVLGLRSESQICWIAGVTSGLLLAFSSVMWSQSVIVEVYSLNAFFLCLILVLAYRWTCRPHENATLYATAYIFGLGLTNHQSLLFLVLGLLSAIWYRNRPLFRDFLTVGLLLAAGLLLNQAANITINPAAPDPTLERSRLMNTTLGLLCLIAPIGLYWTMGRRLMTQWKQVTLVILLTALGVSFYAYMPFSSEQNPPMNWGYPRTTEGFMHAISRGQYEKISPLQNLEHAISHPAHFAKLVWTIVLNPKDYTSVVSQFVWLEQAFKLSYLSLLVPLSVLISLVLTFFTDYRSRGWLVTSFWTFFSMTIIFIVFQYPSLDVQTLFIGRVQYIQAHAIFALWIGYGVAFSLAWINSRLGGRKTPLFVFAGLMLLLPAIPLARNAYDKEFIEFVGACEQDGNDFGWQFGHWQLKGVNGIKADLQRLHEPDEFERIWAEYPTPDYPPEMEPDAIFFGGTDPGRFVPTYMIYSAHCRPDVYLITQNALADNTYMSVMRDLYGDQIWIPSQADSNVAFQQYVNDVQAGRIPPGAQVTMQDGRVSVQGVAGVMMINGILCRQIFDANKHKHPFYIEESYVIQWMYPYLTPHGLIMKLNAEPTQLTQTMVDNDRAFWDWYADKLLENPKFLRDVVARKTFSKLRSAIAGLYVHRQRFDDAEHAFQQAIALYPLSPEASFRLADLYLQQRQPANARQVIEALLAGDPGNDRVASFLTQIQQIEQRDARRRELEASVGDGNMPLNVALELVQLYMQLQMPQQFEALTQNLMGNEQIPVEAYTSLAQIFAANNRRDLQEMVLRRYLQRDDRNARVWIELAAVQVQRNNTDYANSLRRAIELGGAPVRKAISQDARFQPVQQDPAFRALIPQPAAQQLPSFRLN